MSTVAKYDQVYVSHLHLRSSELVRWSLQGVKECGFSDTYVPGEDNSDDLAQVGAAIARRERDLGLYDGDEDSYLDRVRGLVDRRKSLQATPARNAGYVTRGMGETFGEAWQRGGIEFRREILIKSGIRVFVAPKGAPVGGILFTNDEDLQREFPGYQRPELGPDDVDITDQVFAAIAGPTT